MAKKKGWQILLNALKSLLLPIIVFVFFTLASGNRFGFHVIPATSRQAAIYVLLSLAMYVSMQTGGWNFSVGAIVTLTSIMAGLLTLNLNLGLFGLIVLCILIATALSTLVGVLCVVFKIPSILVTIGCLMIFESLSAQFNGGMGVTIRGSLTVLARSPYCYIVALVCLVVVYLLLYKTKLGYDMKAVGTSYLIAKNIGININKTKILAFTVTGLLLGPATILYLSNSSRMEPVLEMGSMSLNFTAMIGVFLGNYISKYCNAPIAIFIGVFTMKMLASGLVSIGLPSTVQDIVTGVFLVVFIGITSNQKKFDQKLEDRKRAKRILERQASAKAAE
ncbi:MAG: ABC transporter permease [Oscillospiraceae bacterium]|jgi:ribose transport system permease protein